MLLPWAQNGFESITAGSLTLIHFFRLFLMHVCHLSTLNFPSVLSFSGGRDLEPCLKKSVLCNMQHTFWLHWSQADLRAFPTCTWVYESTGILLSHCILTFEWTLCVYTVTLSFHLRLCKFKVGLHRRGWYYGLFVAYHRYIDDRGGMKVREAGLFDPWTDKSEGAKWTKVIPNPIYTSGRSDGFTVHAFRV